MNKFSNIVNHYLDEQGLTLRAFADELNEKMGEKNISHVSIANWREGRYEPSTDFLVLLILKYRDWRFDFALECLAAKDPEVWGTEGAIWKVRRGNEAALAES
jgi:hypothetical protein